jgi:hypothetical protein
LAIRRGPFISRMRRPQLKGRGELVRGIQVAVPKCVFLQTRKVARDHINLIGTSEAEGADAAGEAEQMGQEPDLIEKAS